MEEIDRPSMSHRIAQDVEKNLHANIFRWRDGIFKGDLGLIPRFAELFDIAVILLAEVTAEQLHHRLADIWHGISHAVVVPF